MDLLIRLFPLGFVQTSIEFSNIQFQLSFGFLGPKLICYFSLTLRIVKRTFLSKILCVKMPKTVQKIVIFLVLKINLRFYATMFGIEMK